MYGNVDLLYHIGCLLFSLFSERLSSIAGQKALLIEKRRLSGNRKYTASSSASVDTTSAASCSTPAVARPALLQTLKVEDYNKCDQARRDHLDFVVASFLHGNGLSFSLVEDELFLNMIKELCPSYWKIGVLGMH